MVLAYLITWRTYGTYLHGDGDAVDPDTNAHGEPRRPASRYLSSYERKLLSRPPLVLSHPMRLAVHDAIVEAAAFRGWTLLACNVRSNHVHIVVSSGGPPEPAMNALKSWSTRALRRAGLQEIASRTWARHGSTRYLYTERSVEEAIYYVHERQDEARVESS